MKDHKKIEEPSLHGNHARVTPGKNKADAYRFYAGTQEDFPNELHLPLINSENVEALRDFCEENKK